MQNSVTAASAPHTKVAIEWAPFTVVEGVDETRLLAASDALQRDFLTQQPGFIRRELIKGQANQWVDIVHWASMEAALEAGRNAADSPVCHTYFNLMVAVDHDDPSAGVSHFEQVKVYS